jgi:polysaccharide export outer membrane protein
MKKVLQFVLVACVLMVMPSCKFLYPNLMFQQKDYQFFELAQKQIEEYIIEPGDLISLKVFARDGFRLVDVLGSLSNNNQGTNTNNGVSANEVFYVVDQEGFARFPVIGEFFVKGFTIKELEQTLAEKYAGLFVDPFVVAKVENRRVMVFKGSAGVVVSLNEAPTNLIEVIAKAGGLEEGTKAYNIKIIRGNIKNPEVMLVDLSTIEGMRKANLIVQSNDIIYIEKKQNGAAVVFRDIAPYFAFVTSIATLIFLALRFGK